MRLVKTAEEIRRIQSIYARCHYLGVRRLTVLFETTAQAVKALLPPPLEPAPEPLGAAWVMEVANSNCLGPFMSAGLCVRARYQDIVGDYCVAESVSTPEAVTFGRELYGEPAKLAKITFESQGEHVWGSAERHEVRFLSLRGRMADSAPAGRQQTSTFFFKFAPRADGNGFDSPPQLVHVTGDAKIDVAKRGRGELVLRESPHDPVADIPVVQVLHALYTEGHLYNGARTLCSVDPEAFLPYAFTKIDAFEVVAEGTLLHAQAARKTREGKGRWRSSG